MFKFSKPNAKLILLQRKLERRVFSADIISGHSCPFAKECLAKVTKQLDGSLKLTDGPDTKHRCFSASQEVLYTNAYNRRWENFQSLLSAKTVKGMIAMLEDSMPRLTEVVRIHVAGDFFNRKYFQAWVMVALNNPNILFYAYTKSLPYYYKSELPVNLVMTASYGGTHDHLIPEYNLRHSVVVKTEEEAERLGLEIDHDDSHAASYGPSFALLIHGIQPAGSDEGRAVRLLKGKGSYNRKKAMEAA